MTNTAKKSTLIPILIIGLLFFIFGFITWLNGLLIPYLEAACELTSFQSMLVVFAFYIAVVVTSIPSSWVLKKTGFKKGMMYGLWVMSIGALVFIPAAMTRTYFLFLFGLFIMGMGMTLLQTASNPYITILGPIESAASRISIMGICNKVAGAIAPLVLAVFVVKAGDKELLSSLESLAIDQKEVVLNEFAHRVITPYIGIAIALFLVGIGVRFSSLPEIELEQEETDLGTASNAKDSLLDYPYFVFGVIALFLYVGVEVIAGDTIIKYGKSLGIKSGAELFTTFTMIGMLVGYVLGILLIPRFISQRLALAISGVLGILFSLGVIFSNGAVFEMQVPFVESAVELHPSVVFVALLGLANALVWPAIWPLAIHGLGKFIKQGSAVLVMAISGGAILPLIWGDLADRVGSQEAYWILLPAYIMILWYAMQGYKIKNWKNS